MSEHPAVIRPATESDLPAVRDIYNHYVSNTTITFDERRMPLASMRAKFARITGRGLPFLVAERAGEVLGYAYVSPWRPKSAYRFTVENSIYVAPAATGNGVGAALMTELLTACSAAGVTEVVAVISDHGAEGSIRMHERFGFREVGRMERVGFKFGNWIGTVLLQKSLPVE